MATTRVHKAGVFFDVESAANCFEMCRAQLTDSVGLPELRRGTCGRRDRECHGPECSVAALPSLLETLDETARRATPFTLTAEHERLSLVHNEENPKTQFELQKIPDRLEDIATELSRIREFLMNQHQPGGGA